MNLSEEEIKRWNESIDWITATPSTDNNKQIPPQVETSKQ